MGDINDHASSNSVSLDEQQMNPPISSLNKKNFRITLRRVVIILVAFLLFLGVVGLSFYKEKSTWQNLSSVSKVELNVTVPAPTAISNPTQLVRKLWVLKRKMGDNSQAVLSLCGDCYSSYISQWGDWLFYPDFENSSIQIKSYNLKTGKGDTIYDVSQNTSDFKGRGKGLPSEISDMQIIDNTLFFSLGGYLAPGGIFWMDLPPSAKPQKLIDSSNARIKHWKDRYWIIGGEGDACWGFTNYSLLDLSSKKVSHIASSSSGCKDGEEYVDIDKRDRMILAFHTPDFGNPQNGPDGVYQYVTAVPLAKPSVKEVVITKQDMPKEITSVSYIADLDQLVLSGEENYLFDFLTNSLKRVEQPPLIPEKVNPEIKEKSFTEKINEIKLPSDYEFVFE